MTGFIGFICFCCGIFAGSCFYLWGEAEIAQTELKYRESEVKSLRKSLDEQTRNLIEVSHNYHAMHERALKAERQLEIAKKTIEKAS